MSRAFVKEDDSGQAPIIPPRAALPAGVPNYVTPQGLAMLRTELAALETKHTQIETSALEDSERTRQLTILNAQLNALTSRIASAKLIDPGSQPSDQVRFGATVTLRTRNGKQAGTERQFTIVGVDEASVPEGKIAFIAPIARTLTGVTIGQILLLQMGPSQEEVEVIDISYASPEKSTNE
ncbi:transcription elongation factor GreAB [Rhodocytophaga rosea]|uniref:Transcription elongation factor GreAB n=1 Tax=Rhodocytophaga rosea TaxID=2704465 RepID=A0A6C0GKM9_9BACT|nr:GreA/GreB family elongation factor [Rhodocytophaga rosea]QHT68641.1 transcription elongation factor GreAB [Rhodocytophaga rosea]